MTLGTDLTVKAIREGKGIFLVLIACDASDNAKKRAQNCCAYYHVPQAILPHRTAELGSLLGKRAGLAVVGIADKGFADAIEASQKGESNI